MRKLGYKPNVSFAKNPISGIYGFRKLNCEDYDQINLPKFISFKDACRLHNGVTMRVNNRVTMRVIEDWVYLIGLEGNLPKEVLKSAIDARLVKRVYLQRKGKGVKVQQHWIKLVD